MTRTEQQIKVQVYVLPIASLYRLQKPNSKLKKGKLLSGNVSAPLFLPESCVVYLDTLFLITK